MEQVVNSKIKSYLYLSLAMIIVGSSVVVGKIITNVFPVFLATALSLSLASAILVPVLFLKQGFPKLIKKDWFILFLQAFFGIFLFRTFLLISLKFINPGSAGIITSTTPAVIAVISYFLLREKVGLRKTIGILAAVLGILLMQTIEFKVSASSGYLLVGSLLVFGSVIGEALFSVLSKFLSPGFQPLAITTIVTLYALVMSLPFALYQSIGFNFLNVSFLAWFAIVYYGIFLTVVTFFLWFKGLENVEASTAGIFTGLIAVSSITLSWLVFGQKITFSNLGGATFVILGIVLISKNYEHHHNLLPVGKGLR